MQKIIQNNYLEKNSTQDEDENYSYLINYSSHSKNDISSYYPCTRKNSKYHYLIISFFPNETSSKNNSFPLLFVITLNFENVKFIFGL